MGMLKFYRGKNKPKHLTDTQDRPKKELLNLDTIGGYLAVLITTTPVTCYLTPDACVHQGHQAATPDLGPTSVTTFFHCHLLKLL